MYPKILTLIAVAGLGATGLVAGEDAHACCSAARAPEGAAAALSDRSIYQSATTWTNDTGQEIKLASLQGRPVVLAMFFARCEYACPIIVHDMGRIRDALPANARADTQFVLVSFDSVRDTPAALRAYRARAQLPVANWTLLRGAP